MAEDLDEGDRGARPPALDPDGVGTGRGYDRFVNFSDAVVAIAITLLGLPLVDIAPPTGDQTAASVLSDNAGKLTAFAYTFVVVAALWTAHHRVFNRIRGYDGTLMRLNIVYLIAIVLVPFPSEWVGEQGFGKGAGTFYLLTLTVASGSLGLMSWHAHRKQQLLEPWARTQGATAPGLRRSVAFSGFFLLCAVLALPWPNFTSYFMLGLIPVAIVLRRMEARQDASQGAS